MQIHFLCGSDIPRTPRGVAKFGDSSFAPNTFTSSPASPSISCCRCPLASRLQVIAENPVESSRGLFEYFFAIHMALFESFI